MSFKKIDLLNTLKHTWREGIYPASLVVLDEAALWMEMSPAGKTMTILAPPGQPLLETFHSQEQSVQSGLILKFCPTTPENARALRAALPNLQPALLGLTPSAGMGDRMGLATPGHVLAMNATLAGASGKTLAPIFAQQSMREMARTGRTPEQVLDDATWGAFQGGWRDPLGADADHLKTTDDIDVCAAAGFSFYTIDPGDFVDNLAGSEDLNQKVAALPWDVLESSSDDLQRRYAGRTVDLEGYSLSITGDELWQAAAKYGRAVAHVVRLYRHLASKGTPFELEVSVDETQSPTTPVQHYYIASELKRLGVHWVSLAPRFVGRFEKGVDYIGDLKALADDLHAHAAVARALGPYKLSLHSGSDKFSVYPLAAEAARGLIHLKTAGTSYLEALRTLARVEPGLFREILSFARQHYETDRATYHVSAVLARVPDPAGLEDAALPPMLDQFDSRQVLHVTFGSTLASFGEAIRTTLRAHEQDYYAALESHFVRHLAPFL
jgi:tagaturonate epimerase